MADFTQAFKISLGNEGGYVNDPNDAGGETYRGIARNYNPQWVGWAVIDAYKASTGIPKKGYTNPAWDTLAEQFYKPQFWDKLLLDNVTDQNNANQIYDQSLSGEPRTVSIVKAVLNEKFSKKLGTSTTMDTDTVTALNSVPASQFFNEFKNARSDFFKYSAAQLQPADSVYYSLFKKFNSSPNSGNSRYLKGWLNRVNSYAYSGITAIKNNPIKTVVITLSIATLFFLILKHKNNG